jgi:homoserine O-acetyltransferase
MEHRAKEEVTQPEKRFKQYALTHPVESYMHHQGAKFAQRFDANTYLRIIEAWQRFDLCKEADKEDFKALFAPCRHQKYMVFSIDSDVSFYTDEQELMTRVLKKARIKSRRITVHSEKGHDAFLLEPELFTPHLVYSLENDW